MYLRLDKDQGEANFMNKKKTRKNPGRSELYVNPDIVFREEGKEALLFDPNSGSIKVLNHVGKMVWKFLGGKNTKDDIKKKLERKFKDENPNRIAEDLNKFLKTLEGHGYLGKKI